MVISVFEGFSVTVSTVFAESFAASVFPLLLLFCSSFWGNLLVEF
jgi:hypothetical protein